MRKLIILMVLLLVVGNATAKARTETEKRPQQKTTQLTAPLELRVEAIRERQELLTSQAGLSPALVAWTSATLARAASDLADAAELETQRASFENRVATATSQTEELRKRLQALAQATPQAVPSTATTALITQWIAQKEAEIAQRQKALEQIQIDRQTRQQRLAALPQEIAEQQRLLEKIDTGDEVPPPPDSSGGWETIYKAAVQAAKQAVQARIAARQAELKALDATGELLDLREQEAQKLLGLAKSELNALQAAQIELRQREAQQAVLEAQRTRWEAARQHPLLKEVAEDNEKLAQRRAGPDGVPSRIAGVTSELEQAKQLREQIQARYKALKERLQVGGNSDVLGQLMRKERDELMSANAIARQVKQYLAETANVQSELMDARDKRAVLATLERKLKTALSREMKFSSDETSQIVSVLMEQRRALLDALIKDLDDLFMKLTELTTAYALLVEDTRDFASFLDEHILWVRSMRSLSWSDFPKAASGVKFWARQELWLALGAALWSDLTLSWPLYLAVLFLALAVAFWVRRQSYPGLAPNCCNEAASKAGSSSDEIRIWAYLAARPLFPFIFLTYFIGVRLALGEKNPEITEGFGHALMRASTVLWAFLFARAIFMRKAGTAADGHHRLALLVTLCGWCFAAALFLFVLAREVVPRPTGEALERLIFLVSLIFALVALIRATNLASALPLVKPERLSKAIIRRSLGLGLISAIIIICALFSLSIAGYHYTALQILKRLLQSALAVGFVGVLASWLNRWLGRLANQYILRHGRQPKIAADSTSVEPVHTAKGHLTEHSLVQVRHLIRAIAAVVLVTWLWVIWADMLPALAFVMRYPLWTRSELGPDNLPVPVTSGDVLWAILLTGLTVIVVRNVSGLLELLLLRWTHLEQGTRYAIAALARYCVVITAILLVSRSLGLTWKSVQWLAAAVTVGLGFGLQEIFANFVSGLILLFERPVRVGDWITASGTTGVVTHIRTRATTIRDADGKELLIPNKLLITSPVMNWTLSDHGTRLTFDVRVASTASDADIRRILDEVARAHPLVSRKPAPLVLTEGLTNTEQRYRLYVFTYRVDARHELKDQIIAAIREHFAAANIELLLVECPLA